MTLSPCAGCPPFAPCTDVPANSYSDGDQDDTRSWVIQKHYSPPATTTSVGFDSIGSLTTPLDYDQIGSPPEGVLTRLFYSAPIPAGIVEARLSGQVSSTLLHGPGLTGVEWEIIRGAWGDGAPAGIDPGGTLLASGTIDFLASAPNVTAVDFDTGKFSVAGANFQFYIRFVTPPETNSGGIDGEYQLHLRNISFTFDDVPYSYSWVLEFFDCVSTPRENQPIHNEVVGLGDGVTTTFVTDFSYKPYSLAVTVAGFLSDIDASDPTTGAFVLANPPPVGATIGATYRAAGA